MNILILALILALGGCVEGATTKPLTPTETQLITQVVVKRLVVPKLTAPNKVKVLKGVAAAHLALNTSTPQELLDNLAIFLGPENADIAALLVVIFKERVNLTQLTEIQGKEYLHNFLTGIEGGLK